MNCANVRCGKRFERAHPAALYCSSYCKKFMERRRQRERLEGRADTAATAHCVCGAQPGQRHRYSEAELRGLGRKRV